MCILCAYFSTIVATGIGGPSINAELPPVPPPLPPTDARILSAEEGLHLRNVRQLTFGNAPEYANVDYAANYAEAYWSPDGRSLTLQATRDQFPCDQQFTLDLLTGAIRLVSPGNGRVTCGYFTGDGQHCIFASTHETMGPDCPPPPDMSKGYIWPIYDYDIYLSDLSGKGPWTNITSSPGYDAEGTIDWQTGWMYFTSTRDGDLEIYRQNLNDGRVERLTNEIGYDGGPFVSYDGKLIMYRRQFVVTDEQKKDYLDLLAGNMVRPSAMELMVMDADGSNKRMLTANGKANFAPFLHPDGHTVIFCSNLDDPKGREFDLYMLDLRDAGAGRFPIPVRVTDAPEFDGFPMFSPDGKYLVWCSNRNHARAYETNTFIAEWIP